MKTEVLRRLERKLEDRKYQEKENQQRKKCINNHICPECGSDLQYSFEKGNWKEIFFEGVGGRDKIFCLECKFVKITSCLVQGMP